MNFHMNEKKMFYLNVHIKVNMIVYLYVYMNGHMNTDMIIFIKFILSHQVQCVPKKRGISKCHSVCFTAQLMLNSEFSILIHLKIEINMFVPSTEPFLSDIREPRNKFVKNPIWHQLLASSESSSIKTILHRLTVHSQQWDTCWVNKLGKA